MNENNVISGSNISEVWAKVFYRVHKSTGHECSPIIACIELEDTSKPKQNLTIRNELNDALSKAGTGLSIDTVANTIFPTNLWNSNLPREKLYERYDSIWPLIQKCSKNNLGVYFRRMTAYQPEGLEKPINQLERIILSRKKGTKRRSTFQLTIFDPSKDHKDAPFQKFPCLTSVSFVPSKKGLCITGFYPMQSIFERAYGNYLGLINLGQFVAHEMSMPLHKMICISGVAKRGMKDKITPIYNHLEKVTKEYAT